jgi:lysostaphin
LPDLAGYFAIPTTGWNWGRLHKYNAVDIANACGTPIYASAEGLIVEAASSGWNEGYGEYIVIEHPNGTKTKYAHNRKIMVSIGDYVLKGDQIAEIGNTGFTHGPTGCHLHFEIFGAKNPFAK